MIFLSRIDVFSVNLTDVLQNAGPGQDAEGPASLPSRKLQGFHQLCPEEGIRKVRRDQGRVVLRSLQHLHARDGYRQALHAVGAAFSVFAPAVKEAVFIQVQQHRQKLQIRMHLYIGQMVYFRQNIGKPAGFWGTVPIGGFSRLGIHPGNIFDMGNGIYHRDGIVFQKVHQLDSQAVKGPGLDFVDMPPFLLENIRDMTIRGPVLFLSPDTDLMTAFIGLQIVLQRAVNQLLRLGSDSLGKTYSRPLNSER